MLADRPCVDQRQRRPKPGVAERGLVGGRASRRGERCMCVEFCECSPVAPTPSESSRCGALSHHHALGTAFLRPAHLRIHARCFAFWCDSSAVESMPRCGVVNLELSRGGANRTGRRGLVRWPSTGAGSCWTRRTAGCNCSQVAHSVPGIRGHDWPTVTPRSGPGFERSRQSSRSVP